jgi:nucleoside-diphosphate-sugar epimerase
MQKGSKISILGCGWLGLPLARHLLAAGYQVQGSTTTPANMPVLAQYGISPFLLDLQQPPARAALTDFLRADGLVISFPPGLRAGNGNAYLQQMQLLAAVLDQTPTPHILFISSTSVYPDCNRVVTEADDAALIPAGNALRQAERLLQALPGKTVTILRLAGLAGGSRHPGRFLAGKTQVPNPRAPVNLIHQDDCVAIAGMLMQQQQRGSGVYNACSAEHPCREEFYTAAALSLGLAPPRFAPPGPADTFKVISSEKLKQAMHYDFKYPDPRLFF